MTHFNCAVAERTGTVRIPTATDKKEAQCSWIQFGKKSEDFLDRKKLIV